MLNILGKVSCIATIVARSFAIEATDPNALSSAMVVGLYQGLKYKGSIKAGVKGSIATLVVFGTMNSIENIVRNWELVKES